MPTRVGEQRPTHLVTPDGDFDFSEGDAACELAAMLGLHLLDWQRWLVRWILATDGLGRPACDTVIVVMPRQNGKGAVLEAVELYWLLVAEVPVVFHTAHEADTAAGHQARLDDLTADPDVPVPRLKSYKANGKEKLVNLDRKCVLQFRTRTKSTKRGASPQRVVLDECQELQDEHLAALVPTLAAQSMDASKRPQLIYTGSAPLEHSQYMHRLLDRVLAVRPARTLLAMWACSADDDPSDVDNWYRSNPSLGVLIDEQWVRDVEFVTMAPVDFAAERLGVPKGGDQGGDGPISPVRWLELTDGTSMAVDETVSLGLCAPLDRESAVFSVFGRREDGLPHVAIREWLPRELLGELPRVAARLCEGHGVQLNVPSRSPARAWLDALERAGVPVNLVSEPDMGVAQLALEQEVAEGTLRHRGQSDMIAAVEGLAARVSGDSSPWSRRSSSSNVAPLMAAAAARAGGRGVPEKRPAVWAVVD